MTHLNCLHDEEGDAGDSLEVRLVGGIANVLQEGCCDRPVVEHPVFVGGAADGERHGGGGGRDAVGRDRTNH